MFVDFDNIFITYASEDEELAKEFATKPEKWLEWIEKQMPAAHLGDSTERKVLIRRCYMNPVVFAQHRPFFTRAGFEVIDCPPLTTRGKTSTDKGRSGDDPRLCLGFQIHRCHAQNGWRTEQEIRACHDR
jgi:hypothetical protein